MGNFKGVRFVLIYTMLLNLVATGVKLFVGYLTGSLSLIADGFDSLFDSLSNVIGLVAIHLARRPADEDHPYGHRRYEILMTMLISLLLFFTCFEILKSAYERLLRPVRPEVTIWSFVSLLVSIAVHVYVTTYEKRRGEELRSEFLVADAMHTRADIFISVGVMAGLIVVQMGYPILDSALAVVIAVLIARIGVDIIRSSTRILTDSAALDVSKVTEIVVQVPGVTSCHHIRSRGQEDDIHLDLHIRVAPNMPLAEAHHIAHQVQRRLLESIPGARDVVVHVEPQPGTRELPEAGGNTLASVQKAAQAAGASFHHLNAHEIDGRYFVDLHLEVPRGLTLGEAHAQATRLEERIRAEAPEIAEINTHIEPALTPASDCAKLDDSQIVQLVREATRDMPEVLDCHEIQALRVEGRLLLTVHCTLREQLPIAQAHDITTAIEDRLQRSCAEIADVTVHVEPDASSTSE
jgi:cation diffusion facilitator family transporter